MNARRNATEIRCLTMVVLVATCIVVQPERASAGLYYSGETYANLPSQWRGFLLDQRALRNLAVPAAPGESSAMRQHYLDAAKRLEEKLAGGVATADDIADLGAIHVRLGAIQKAVDILRQGQREHPRHFAIHANLGTAWQLLGDLVQAERALEESTRLAPGRWLAAEQLHLKLVSARRRQKTPNRLDDLFGVRYGDARGDITPGRIDPVEYKKLPAKSLALAQQLALWLPADGPLLWQLAELANAHGDTKTAASMFEGCVVQFGMTDANLRRRRQLAREAATKGEDEPAAKPTTQAEHETHRPLAAFRSRKPLLSKWAGEFSPPISATGTNALPWELFGETVVESPFRPKFPKYLEDVENRQVAVTGSMQPIGEDNPMARFLFIEFPVGCWFCEMPDTASIVFVELAGDQTTTFRRGLLRVTGRLSLNRTDPESFLVSIRDARVSGLD